ncbi:zinc finger protein CONSTANS-LIKE 16-like [Typha angustifolia]|uniref:zinc finger protein CONSTANS-LIKE 16-like n=1 Tax=Typha angustifolia TaxID=59011 RepID=UPI003C2BA50A
MSNSEKHRMAAASAVGAKTARACDGCLRRRARWYCAADDAFLCQACDTSVHTANPLARRHHRLRLASSSSRPPPLPLDADHPSSPAWLHGFKRKARTPRGKTGANLKAEPTTLVPDLEEEKRIEEEGDEEEEEEAEVELLYRVPIFDPILTEFCSPPRHLDECNDSSIEELNLKPAEVAHVSPSAGGIDDDVLTGFQPSDIDLAEFAADMENLLGLGLTEDGEKPEVKAEFNDVGMEMEIEFDCGDLSSPKGELLEEQIAAEEGEVMVSSRSGDCKMMLRLDYEAVITAWSHRDCSPWTDGERPQFNPDDCLPDFPGMWNGGGSGDEVGLVGAACMAAGDGGREARVSRYREKRRTRLFSKKIRYEVRKLNAEKRPRMKGRFVKRAAFLSAPPAVGAAPIPGPFAF